jgi:hypothetical protein
MKWQPVINEFFPTRRYNLSVSFPFKDKTNSVGIFSFFESQGISCEVSLLCQKLAMEIVVEKNPELFCYFKFLILFLEFSAINFGTICSRSPAKKSLQHY